MIEITDLHKKTDKVLFNGFNLKISKKGVYQILGKNGIGKTTLFDILTCNTDFGGQVVINGLDLNKIDKSSLFNNYIAYVKQEDELFDHLTAIDNLQIFGCDNRKIVTHLINEFDFKANLDKKVKILSGGERKKLQLIIALSFQNPILLLDEVDNHLDDESIRKIIKIIYNYDGIVLFTMHSQVDEQVMKIEISPVANIQYLGDSQLNIDFKTKKSHNNETLFKKMSKSKYFILTILVSLLLVISNVLILYDVQTTVKDYDYVSEPYFPSDNVLIVQPPVDRLSRIHLDNPNWYKKTPFFIGDDILNIINDSGINATITPLYKQGTYKFTFNIDGVQYYFTDDNDELSNAPKEVASKTSLNGIPLDYIEGEIPNDDSYEMVISESLSSQLGKGIGDFIDVGLHLDDDNIYKTFEIVGINHFEQLQTNTFAYQSVNDQEIYELSDPEIRSEQIDYVQSNTSSSNIAKKLDDDEQYYYAILVECESKDDTIDLIDKVYDYDPYLMITSNHDAVTSQNAVYFKGLYRERVINLVFLYLVFMIVLVLIYILENRYFNKDIKSKLYSNGYSYDTINKLYNKRMKINHYPFIITILINVILLFVINTKISVISILLPFIFYGVFLVTIRRISNNGN